MIDYEVAAVMTAGGLFANSMMDTGKGSAIEFLIPAGFVAVPVASHILYRRTHMPARFIGLLIWTPIIISVIAIMIAIRLWG